MMRPTNASATFATDAAVVLASPAGHPEPGMSAEDHRLLAALRGGDEQSFTAIVTRYHEMMVRLAMAYVPSRAVAEDVAQEAWLGVLQGLDRFEGRCSMKSWIFTILTNRARTRGQREGRSAPFSSITAAGGENESAVDMDRFFSTGQNGTAGRWVSQPTNWDEMPEERLMGSEVRAVVTAAVEGLPQSQQAVITLRDIEGFSAEEACNVLGITETNQQVLLHRARSKVRRAVEAYLNTH